MMWALPASMSPRPAIVASGIGNDQLARPVDLCNQRLLLGRVRDLLTPRHFARLDESGHVSIEHQHLGLLDDQGPVVHGPPFGHVGELPECVGPRIESKDASKPPSFSFKVRRIAASTRSSIPASAGPLSCSWTSSIALAW